MKIQLTGEEYSFALILSDAAFILLINVKMPTIIIVGILTFKSRIKLLLNSTEHELNS